MVLSSDAEARTFAEDLATFGAEPVWFPAREAFGTRFLWDLVRA